MGLSDLQLSFHPSDIVTREERVLWALLLSNELQYEGGRVALTFVLSSGSWHLRRALWFKPTGGGAVFAGELETETLCRKVVQCLRAAGKSVVAYSEVWD